MNTTSRLTVIALSTVLVAAAFTGCSISVSQPAATTPSTTPRGAVDAPVPTDTGAVDEPEATDSTPQTAPADDARMARLHRTTWEDAVTQHLTCTGEPFTLGNTADALVVEIAGDCTDVTILAHAATVLVPDVGMLTVVGDGSVVIATSIENLVFDATADANLVGWEKGTPVIKDAGTLNATSPIR